MTNRSGLVPQGRFISDGLKQLGTRIRVSALDKRGLCRPEVVFLARKKRVVRANKRYLHRRGVISTNGAINRDFLPVNCAIKTEIKGAGGAGERHADNKHAFTDASDTSFLSFFYPTVLQPVYFSLPKENLAAEPRTGLDEKLRASSRERRSEIDYLMRNLDE